MRPVWLYNIFPCHLTNGTIFDKIIKLLFSPPLMPETFLIRRIIKRDTVINVQRFSFKKVKQSLYSPRQALRVPGGSGSRIS